LKEELLKKVKKEFACELEMGAEVQRAKADIDKSFYQKKEKEYC